MSDKVSIDFETHSADDLIKNGTYHYSKHSTTGIYMLSYAFDEDAPKIWTIGQPFPKELINYIKQNKPVHAFNAEFEYLIWNHILVKQFSNIPSLTIEQLRCTAAQGRVNSLPNSLDLQTKAMGLKLGKSQEGKALIMKYSVTNTAWKDIPKLDQNKFIQYCKDDVLVERLLSQTLRELSPNEWEDYHNIVKMNMRGIQVDIDFAKAAINLANQVRLDVKAKLIALTEGKIEKATERKARDLWLLPKLTEEQIKAITIKGSLKLDKTRRQVLFSFPDLDTKARRYLELVEEAGGSTLSKYDAMVRSHVNGRIYGAFMFNSATTGRMSSKLVQLQNLKRPIFDDEEALALIEDVIAGNDIPNPADTLAYLVRPTIYLEEGMTTYDYSSVEYIVLSYLAGNKKAIEDYKNNIDAYKELGSQIFKKLVNEVTKDERQASKIVILAAGFGGGKGAVQSMAVAYGVKFTTEEAQALIDAYRKTHRREVQLWHDTNSAVMNAVLNPFKEFSVASNKIKYEYDGESLWCQLPSGRYLRYIDAKREKVEMPWGDLAWVVTYKNTKLAPAARETKWPRATLSHIVAVENYVQAFANDLLRDALAVCEQEDIRPFMAVHDEISVPNNKTKIMHEIMSTPPEWCSDMPLHAEGKFAYMFGK